MVTDANNNIWVACAKGGNIICINSKGECIHIIKMPVEFITSCCFGGEHLDKLYITTSRFLPEENLINQPQAGGLFEVDLSGFNKRGTCANCGIFHPKALYSKICLGVEDNHSSPLITWVIPMR